MFFGGREVSAGNASRRLFDGLERRLLLRRFVGRSHEGMCGGGWPSGRRRRGHGRGHGHVHMRGRRRRRGLRRRREFGLRFGRRRGSPRSRRHRRRPCCRGRGQSKCRKPGVPGVRGGRGHGVGRGYDIPSRRGLGHGGGCCEAGGLRSRIRRSLAARPGPAPTGPRTAVGGHRSRPHGRLDRLKPWID
jgi:hypothetical protein